jgi:hypothetical protein
MNPLFFAGGVNVVSVVHRGVKVAFKSSEELNFW